MDILTPATMGMNLEDIILVQISQAQKRQIQYDSPYRWYLEYSASQRQKTEWWWPGAGGNKLFNRDRVSVLQEESIVEIDDGDGCLTM